MVASPVSASRCVVFAIPSRGFDPSIACAGGRTLAAVCTPDNLKLLHDNFQSLCECNTARIDKEFTSSATEYGNIDIHACSTSSKRFSPDFEPVTVFHSKTLAKLSLLELGKIMMRSVGCLEEMLAVTVLLCARYCASSEVKPTTHLMHRLYVACLQVALKAHSDHYYRNSHYAYLAGISANEMNRQESELLRGTCWSVQVTAHQVEDVLSRLRAGNVLPTLTLFSKPAEPFESMRSYESFSASHGLSQSNMELLPKYSASTSLAEKCPVKIEAALSNASQPLQHAPGKAAQQAQQKWSHQEELQNLRSDLERRSDSPRSLAGSEDDDEDDV